jgi:tRNA-2-methylthio-N6-dimethylallyladenosine synthase
MIKFFIKTYGCQANIADSTHLKRFLEGLGCSVCESELDAEIIIVNTCAIREKAEHRMFSYLGSIAPDKIKKKFSSICVIGCVASYRKEEIFSRFPHVTYVFSARDDVKELKAYLGDLVSANETHKKIFPQRVGSLHSMINIMRGCNNYCSYCIVPFTTGRERSFPMSEILGQIKSDVQAGAKEITLLGQNVNSYKDPDTGARFHTLLEKAAQIDGEFWIRFVSPHPKDITNNVIDVMADYNDKLCAYLHLPLQSGSDKILESMNRTYTSKKYLDVVDEVKKRIPSMTFTTDIIVGFPGETDEDYRATREVMERVGYTAVFSFVYSPRKYTKAAQFVDDCYYEVKKDRLRKLQARQREIGTAKNKNLVGERKKVLFEDDTWGRTEGNVKVFLDLASGVAAPNTFMFVDIVDAKLSDLTGRVGKNIVRKEINI